jgi:glycosyltransferase involved in cell wall biosynthesis
MTTNQVSDKSGRKNILLVISSISGAGAELVVANLCRTINRELFNVSVCHLKERGEKGEQLCSEGYDIVALPGKNPGKTNYFSFLTLKKLLLEKDIDLLHSHDRASLFDCAQAKIITPRVKLLHTFHFGNYPHIPKRHLLLEGFFSRFVDQLVAVGHGQKKQISTTFKIQENRIKTIYNGIQPLPYTPPEKATDGIDTPLIIGAMSTFTQQKGISYLLEIALKIKNAEGRAVFWVAGDGPLRPQLEKDKKAMGLDEHVLFLGWIPDAAQKILPQIDIFLQTSLWEAMSVAILEAMSAGKPVVATDVGENRIITEKASSGFIVKPRDTEETVRHLLQLIDNRELRLELGKNGRTAVNSLYNVDTMTKNYEETYSTLVTF